MTIALGLIGNPGIVFAADTEETWGSGDIKTANTKIVSGARASDGTEPYAIAVAGAGDSDYLQAAKFDLLQKTIANPSWQYNAMGELTEEFLIDFYKKHVVPFWPNSRNFELLIGVSGRTQGALWATAESTLRPCVFGSEAIGTGRAYATALLSRYYTPTMTLESCCLLAIHVIHSVKEFIGGCGKQTQVVVLTNGQNALLSQEKIDEAEGLLKRTLSVHSNITRFVMSASDDMRAATREAKNLKKRLKKLDLLSAATPTDRSVTIRYGSGQPPSQE